MKAILVVAAASLTMLVAAGSSVSAAPPTDEEIVRRCNNRGLVGGQIGFCINRDKRGRDLDQHLKGQQQKKQ